MIKNAVEMVYILVKKAKKSMIVCCKPNMGAVVEVISPI